MPTVQMMVDDGDEPVSPTGQYFNSSVLSICIIAAFELEGPIDDSQAKTLLENLLLPVSPRFSSIMLRDKHGTQQWRKVNVKLEDHIFDPTFPPNLSIQSYEEHVQDYVSNLSINPLPQNLPLWQLHIIKYPTRNSAGTLVFKLHHALGDGFSLMGALFSCLQRTDNPSLPLTFPRLHGKSASGAGGIHVRGGGISDFMLTWFNTTRDFIWGLMKSSLAEDSTNPIRSATPGLESRPVTISSVIFSLNSIQQIKARVGGTVNDVISGIIFYATQLYIQKVSGGGTSGDLTALVLLNTRTISSYQTLEEMNDPNAKSRWGNQFGFLHVPIPKCEDAEGSCPLDFVFKAKDLIKRKRNSLAVYLTAGLLEMLRKIKGSEVAAQYILKTLKSTSMTVSNMIGPLEQMHIAGHPVGSVYFMVVGVPQSLTITVFSYMGKLRVAMGTEKDFIDSKVLVSCMEKAFERIFEEAVVDKRS